MNKAYFFVPIIVIVTIIFYYTTYLKKPTNQIPLNSNKTIFSFFGAPGSGKGTLAEQCAQKLKYLVLSTGNLCRQHIAQKTELGEKLQKYTNAGKLVPDDIITLMVRDWLEKTAKENRSIILDGYPRTEKQADMFLDLLKKTFPDYKLRIISLDIPDEEVVKRISNRLMCENKKCQAVYNTTQFQNINNPTCHLCQSKLIKREDDKEEVVRERLKVYAESSSKLLNFYKSAGQKIEHLNVSEKSIEKVFEEFKTMSS